MRLRILALFCLPLVAGMAAPKGGWAQQDRWLHLGQSSLIENSTESLIPATSTQLTVCSIRMQTTVPIEIQEVTVHFSNHQTQRIQFHSQLSGEGFSQALALPGVRRSVASVTLVYSPLDPALGVPEVRLSGNELLGAKYCPR